MKNKTALVTGGMGGIGIAICQHFIDQGANVMASYNRGGDHEAARLWREEQLKNGYDIAIRYVDVTDFHSCENMVKDNSNDVVQQLTEKHI
jgi:acetoacetyl-CoA reductase